MATPPDDIRTHIIIEAYDPSRALFAREAADELDTIFRGLGVVSVEHVGATAVEGLAGQPIVDFAARVPTLADADRVASPAWTREASPHAHSIRFVGCDGGRVIARLDVFDDGTPQWIRRKRFRDALRANSGLRDEYTKLRLALAKEFGNNAEAYVRGKSAFVERALVAPASVKAQQCPVCALPTLDGRGNFEICGECGWEDDGQDDVDADDVRGGPNGWFSLSAARLNYARTGAFDDAFVPTGAYPDVPALITPIESKRR